MGSRVRNLIRELLPRAAILVCAAMLAACAGTRPPAPIPQPPPQPIAEQPTFTQEGVASWYGPSHNGRKTANGETFDMYAPTAAHRTLKFNTVVRVTNLTNGRTIWVRINDRGPYSGERVIDLSMHAARDLGMQQAGIARVRIEQFESDQTEKSAAATR